MRLYLVRHAEHAWLGRGVPGRKDIHITETGRCHAECIAEYLAAEGVRHVYSSPQRRAVQTAQPLAALLGVKVCVAEEAAELDFGCFEGRLFSDLQDDPDWIAFNEDRVGVRAPNGESLQEGQARVVSLIERIAQEHPEEHVAVFGHNDPWKLALAHYLGMELVYFYRLSLDPGCVSCLDFQPTGPQLVFSNYRPF